MDALKPSLAVLAALGNWKPINLSHVFLFNIWRIFVCPLPFLLGTLQFLRMILVPSDMDELTEIAFTFFAVLNVCSKYLCIIFRRKYILKLINLMTTPIATANDEQEREIQKQYRRFIWLFSVVFMTVIESVALTFLIPPFFQAPHHRTLPFKLYIPFDYSSSETVFWSIFLIFSALVVSGSMHNGAGNAFILSFLMEAVGQYNLLNHRISVLPLCDPKDEKRLLVQSIRHHMFILKYVDGFKEAFQPAITNQFFLSGCVITMSVYQLSVNSAKMDVVFFTNFFFLLCMMGEFFFYCLIATELTEKSTNFLYHVFGIDWMNLKPQSRKDLLFVMVRSCKPATITNGFSTELTLETFMSVIKLSYSTFNLLRE